MTKNIDLRLLKENAHLFPDPVRTLILEEPDSIEVGGFISKFETWEKLLKIAKNGGS